MTTKWFSSYLPDTGEIMGTMMSDEESVHTNLPEGREVVEGEYSPYTHYIVDGEATAYTAEEMAKKAAKPSFPSKWCNGIRDWIDLRNLDELKASKKQALKTVRDEALATFTWDGSVFDSDPNSKINLLGLYTASQASGFSSETWRLADNSWRVLDASDVSQVWVALQMHVRSCFGRFAMAEAAVMAATTAEEVAAVEF